MDTDEKAASAALDVDELFADFEEAADQEGVAPPVSEPPPVERVHRKDKVLALKAENRRLREEVRLLKRISASATGVPNSVGPLAHMCFFNRKLSVESRRRIEDFVLELSTAHRRAGNVDDPDAQNKSSHWSTRTQPSCVRLTSDTVEFVDDVSDDNGGQEEPMDRGSVTAETSSAGTSMSTAGLAITGSIQAHEGFLIDTVGAPLVEDLPVASPCFATSVFQRGFHHVLPADQEEITAKASRGGLCFNCSKPGHALHDCKMPRDEAAVQRNRQQFSMNRSAPRTPMANRYHADPSNVTDGQVSKFRPGVISDELRSALGLGENDVPLHIYRMRVLGYPPAYHLVDDRKRYGGDKIKCSLSLYSGDKDATDDAMDVEELDRREPPTPKIEYTPTARETIRFPGFNAPLPTGTVDNSQQLGYPPFAGGSCAFAKEDKLAPPPAQGLSLSPVSPADTPTDASTTNAALDITSKSTSPASRSSAKFSRGNEHGNAEDSLDEAEDGEILSRTASPNVAAAAANPAAATGSRTNGDAAAGQPAVVDLTMSPVLLPVSSDATGDESIDTGAPAATGDSEQIDLIDLDAEKVDDDSVEPGQCAVKRQWSTDFPPDMAPAEGELQHRWLKLRRLVDERRS